MDMVLQALHCTPTQQFIMEQEQEGENPQQTFCEYSIIRDIVLKVLKAQGIPNPSDEVIDSAIKEHLTPKVLGIIKKMNSEKSGPWTYTDRNNFWEFLLVSKTFLDFKLWEYRIASFN